MKGEHQQDGIRNNEERPLKYSTAEQAGRLNRSYFSRTERLPAFLVLREGQDDRHAVSPGGGTAVVGPCFVRGEEWLMRPEIAALYHTWLASEGGLEADRCLQRIYHFLRASAAELLESPDGGWVVVSLLRPEELAVQPSRLAALQDAQLEALFAAISERHMKGGDSRLDLLAAYPASGAEFAAQREFIENVAEQTLGHAFAAACRIGALIAPDAGQAAGEIARIADFLVLDGAADEAAPGETAAEGFALAAEEILAAVRRVKPAAVVLAAGPTAAPALADLYLIGFSGIFCTASQRTEALLRAACLTWMARHESVDSSIS
ncbi:hypothetical protein [Paenibacillus sp. sgz500958]|uniref:hypothetical protein n=1 Tax=Paenibacillus sp. sgz500958 TaxID=3242475 RepID=UPI0036D29F87